MVDNYCFEKNSIDRGAKLGIVSKVIQISGRQTGVRNMLMSYCKSIDYMWCYPKKGVAVLQTAKVTPELSKGGCRMEVKVEISLFFLM